jgi:hypothetical protein
MYEQGKVGCGIMQENRTKKMSNSKKKKKEANACNVIQVRLDM